jgi:hypothetical protein
MILSTQIRLGVMATVLIGQSPTSTRNAPIRLAGVVNTC